MTLRRLNPGRSAQSQYLTDLLRYEGLSAREIARQSAVIAATNGKPELAVGHQAVSAWVNGTRHPNAKHKRLLATILGVSLANLNHACDGEDEYLDVQPLLKLTTVIVHGSLQSYRYSVAVRTDINLTEPAIYRDWSDIFSFRPVRLMRHLRNMHYELFGWVPDSSASPMVRYPHCLVPIEGVSQRTVLRTLDVAESAHRRVWFVYLPGGKLHVGIGYRDNRSFSLARNNGSGVVIENFPLSRVDFVGYFTGKVLFHLLPTTKNLETDRERQVSRKQ